MSRTVLETYLAERLQSARGLGWPLPEDAAPKTDAPDPCLPDMGRGEQPQPMIGRRTPDPGLLIA